MKYLTVEDLWQIRLLAQSKRQIWPDLTKEEAVRQATAEVTRKKRG